MFCEKCNQLNDAMSVKCVNCGSTLIGTAHNGNLDSSATKKDGPMRGVLVVAGAFIFYQVFEYFAKDLFQPSFGSLNYFRIFCAAIGGAMGGVLGGIIADHVLDKSKGAESKGPGSG